VSDERPTAPLDQYASWLSACDDEIAAGGSPRSVYEAPAEVRTELERDLEWCRFLREAWPRERSAGEGSEPRLPDVYGAEVHRPFPLDHLARFQIRRELGRGTFGIVFLAYDPQLRREVALKIPKPEVLASPALRARFHHEARVAGGLSHPNLVPVFEAGEEQGICYIASAYCQGVTLAHWLKKQFAPVPYRKAALLLSELAAAIDHAHHRGVLHRDIKPSNVILEPRESSSAAAAGPDALDFTPRVTDFGLAKCLDPGPEATAATATQAGTLVGTPAYMAPELAMGRVEDAAPSTDVYALGAVFYEVLTGRPPFQADSTLETLLMIRMQEPVQPSRLRPGIPRDLETICLTCLAKEPRKRYADAGALREDVERFLAGRPILARPVSAAERLLKWAKRNRGLAAAILLAIGAVVTAFGVILFSNVQLRTERNYSDAKSRLALANLRKAQEAVNRMLTQVSVERLRDVPQMEQATLVLLEDALTFYRGFEEQAGDDADIRLETARVYHRLASRYEWIRRHERALECERHSVSLYENLVARQPADVTYRRELAGAITNLARGVISEGPPAATRKLLDRARKILDALAAEDPKREDVQFELARNLSTQASLYGDEGNDAEEKRTNRRVLEMLTELVDKSPNNSTYLNALAVVRGNLAVQLDESGRHRDAENDFRQNVNVLETLITQHPESSDYRSKMALTVQNLAICLGKQGRNKEAEAEYERAVEIRLKLASEYPLSPYFRARAAEILGQEGKSIAERGDLPAARRVLERAVVLQKETLDLAPSDAVYLDGLRVQSARLVALLGRLEDHAEIVNRITELTRLKRGTPGNSVEVAEALVGELPAIERDATLASDRKAAIIDIYSKAAVAELGSAITSGAPNAAKLKDDPRFVALRARPDFQALFAKDSAVPPSRAKSDTAPK
jgi:serine/threonine protein kinase